ncbi:uncharacterized protein J4E84_001594 [Alternaria hordeiaustralica]|uniref:uncharacterized protein n=1 Tax=Alternaria hordeiaustralica TaxID=1187925 RepID=UPI0020C1F245|nr:uncharacterized protein J4E84_001594 [Alternaria hordeiaustralica]KAI4694970.1 hypothetical protein J4E84_001594 [Alternaria hordeiaustralica]
MGGNALQRGSSESCPHANTQFNTLQLACDTIDNFAHSKPAAAAHIGSLVDANVHTETKGAGSNETTVTSFDFKTQMEQYVAYDKGRRVIPERLRKGDEWTFFTVFFGLWDLLEYSTLEKPVAMSAVDKSIESLFHSLDILAEHAAHPPNVVIPKMIDASFLPQFQVQKKAMREADFAVTQHRMVFLWSYWNTVLVRKAAEWKNGAIYMPEPNAIIMNEVRAKQLHSRQISDATGVGAQAPLFEHVDTPCLDAVRGSGGPAHELIGKHAANLVRGNRSINAVREKSEEEKKQEDERVQFKLKFPPGY